MSKSNMLGSIPYESNLTNHCVQKPDISSGVYNKHPQ